MSLVGPIPPVHTVRPFQAGSVLERLPAGGAGLGRSAHLNAARGAVERKLDSAGRTGHVILAQGGAALRAYRLAAAATSPLLLFDLGAADRARPPELKSTVRAALHLWRQLDPATRAAELQLTPAGWARRGVLVDRLTTSRAQ